MVCWATADQRWADSFIAKWDKWLSELCQAVFCIHQTCSLFTIITYAEPAEHNLVSGRLCSKFLFCRHTDHFVQKKNHKTWSRSTKPCSTEKDDNQSRNQLSWTGVLGKLNLELNQLSQRKPDCVELCPRGRLWDQTSELDRFLAVLSGWTEECSVLFQANKEWKLEENKWFRQSQIWGEALQTEAELWGWRFGEMEEMMMYNYKNVFLICSSKVWGQF